MSKQKDISQGALKKEEIIEKDIDRLSPLNVPKPDMNKEGIQSTEKERNEDSSLCLSIRDYVTSYITFADTKAGVLIGVFSGLLSFTFINNIELLKISLETWSFLHFSLVLSWFFLVLGIFSSLVVIWPRALINKKFGVVSWVHISNYSSIDLYMKDVLSSDNSRLVKQLYELNYDLSIICRKKYVWLRRAFLLGFTSLIMLGIFTVKYYL